MRVFTYQLRISSRSNGLVDIQLDNTIRFKVLTSYGNFLTRYQLRLVTCSIAFLFTEWPPSDRRNYLSLIEYCKIVFGLHHLKFQFATVKSTRAFI